MNVDSARVIVRALKDRVRRALASPDERVRAAVRGNPDASFGARMEWDLVDRPQFAYGVYHAAREGSALGHSAISVIELGVAGGNGLLNLERIAAEVEGLFGVRIDVWGFDLGSGLPQAVDYRDCPYIWKPGYFAMDEGALRRRLDGAHLVIGDVAETIPATVETMAPVGFIAFDLDYYSSTVAAFSIFDASAHHLLPRVFCYFDDIVGDDAELHCDYAGELLAIAEYNAAHEDRKLAKIHGLTYKRRVRAAWNDMIFVHHSFTHPDYTTHIGRDDWQMPAAGNEATAR